MGMGTEGFRYGDLDVLVVSPRGHLDWLREFLSPSFSVGLRPSYAVTVTLCEDAEQFAEAVAQRPAAGVVDQDCFVNDRHMVRLPVWISGRGLTIAVHEGIQTMYVVGGEGRTVTIVSPDANPYVRTALMRVVRELAMNHSRHVGGLFLHAAAVAADGRGVAIAGEKHAGKTSFLTYLLREMALDYVSNDRVLVPAAAPAIMRGMPTIVTLRPGLLALFPAMRSDLLASSYYHQRSLAEAATHRGARPWADGSFGLSPAQFCALVGVDSRAECALTALVFPRITGEPDTGRLRDLSAEKGAARLRPALLSAGLPKKTSGLLTVPGDPPAPEEDALVEMSRQIAGRVRCVECQLGTRAFDTPSLATECLRALGY